MENKIKITALGGVQEYGKNLYTIEDNENMIVIDAGVKFPEFSHFGIEKIISNFDYLLKNQDKLKAIFISHAHEENVGALEYLLKRMPNVTVYVSTLTRRYLELVLPQFRKKFKDVRGSVKIGTLDVSLFEMPHTIYGNCAILINTPQGAIVYDGDSSFDSINTTGFNSQLSDLIINAKNNKNGVLALFLNSRNSMVSNNSFNNSANIKRTIVDVFFKKVGKLFVVLHSEDLLTFSMILEQAKKDKLKVYINSYKLFNYLQAARKVGLLKTYSDTITTDYSEIEENNGIVILGEDENQLFNKIEKIAKGQHPVINLYGEDSIFVSTISNILNEGDYQKQVNDLFNYTQNVYMMSPKTVLAPYMTYNELKLFVNLFNPKYIIPRNGEYRELMRIKNNLSSELNITKNNILVLNKGNYVSFFAKKTEEINYRSNNSDLYIENGRYGDTENRVLSDRERFSEAGMLVANIAIKRNSNKIIGKPKFISSGLLEEKHKRELNSKLNEVIKELIAKNTEEKIVLSSDEFKHEVYRVCAKVLRKQYNQQPQIFVIIMEI